MTPARLLIMALALPGAAVGCFPEAEPLEPVRLVALRPERDVDALAAVECIPSGALVALPEGMTVVVTDDDGHSVAASAELGAEGWALRVYPDPLWPAGRRLSLTVEGVVGAHGAAFVPDVLTFQTAGPPQEAPPTLVLRTPAQVPSNLRFVWGIVHPPDLEVHAIALDGNTRISAEVDYRGPDGSWRARLRDDLCRPLCPGSTYAVTATTDRGDVTADTLLRVGTDIDAGIPLVQRADFDAVGDRARLHLETSEPVWPRGILVAATGTVALDSVGRFDRQHAMTTAVPLTPELSYRLELSFEDRSGNGSRLLPMEIVMPPALDIRISEAVLTPLRDWNDSVPRGVPYDALPGGGSVTDADEWVELVNHGTTAVDLREADLYFRAIDGTPRETRIEHAPAIYFGDGGTVDAWLPGEALVFRPQGSMSQTEILLELWAGAQLLDRWSIGDALDSLHPGGAPANLHHDALAKDRGGIVRWCAPTPLDPVPPIDCSRL